MKRRPRSVWFALGTGVIVTVIVATIVLVPVIGLVTSAVAAAPFVDFPIDSMIVAVIGGYALAAGFLALILRIRHGALAWICSVAAVIAALVVSIYPLVAAAIAAANEAGEVIPIIVEWIGRLQQQLS
ncbi:hypothetical protein SAMN06295879_0034 [Agreia bicolorata]|uniref:Uncharacterized protein n=1 Tax=Agreia bicolorata TaxID=110935 RepID=A0A1T4WR61_9MICO|nr:hypothetical protein [Agreia bicolorata]KJC64325.1 hypothetical protein TZ00_07655 [Agreia bicolorata]SKA79355.1 hypothetical protein SAMN06295879_0034 [Agreia bicolorata]